MHKLPLDTGGRVGCIGIANERKAMEKEEQNGRLHLPTNMAGKESGSINGRGWKREELKGMKEGERWS